MANKFDGDVRPLSNDQRYMGVVFSGPMDEAIRQAHDAPDHGRSEQFVPAGVSRDRAALLEHLNLLPRYSKYSAAYAVQMNIINPAFAVDPEPEYGVPAAPAGATWSTGSLADRFEALSERQVLVYVAARRAHGVRDALGIAEAYPYPAPRS